MNPPGISQASKALVVGGWDPSGHAGIMADWRVFGHFRIPLQSVLTAVTAQNLTRHWAWEAVSTKIFRQQLQAVGPLCQGIKIGMIATPQHALTLARWIQNTSIPWVLWDPVLKSSTGGNLLQSKTMENALWSLWKQCHVLTPNLMEAEWILQRKLQRAEQLEQAALDLFAQGGSKLRGLLLKGGHWETKKKQVWDFYFDGKKLSILKATRRPTTPRGTGCTLASAWLAQLLLGEELFTALKKARRYLLGYHFE